MSDVRPWGVGMPAWLYLHQFGDICEQAFGSPAFLVGSALRTKTPRDVDVVVEISDAEFMKSIGPVSEFGKPGTRWAALTMAFAALGQKMTGCPIDFKVQFSAVWLGYCHEDRLRLSTKDSAS